MPEYNGVPVRAVKVRAVVECVAYAVVDEAGEVDTARMALELADAVEFRAPNLEDTGAKSSLVALAGGGSGHAANVEVTVTLCEGEFDARIVREAVEATAAWIP